MTNLKSMVLLSNVLIAIEIFTNVLDVSDSGNFVLPKEIRIGWGNFFFEIRPFNVSLKP